MDTRKKISNRKVLNDRTENTKKIIHIMITSLCNRNCKDCCNRLYDYNTIEYASPKELSECETVFLTGGEPFLYGNPNAIGKYLKKKYKNIKKVIVYTNAIELANYLKEGGKVDGIDGVTVSLKVPSDIKAFDEVITSNKSIRNLPYNMCYWFEDYEPITKGNFAIQHRNWQTTEEYKPNPNSIFRKL